MKQKKSKPKLAKKKSTCLVKKSKQINPYLSPITALQKFLYRQLDEKTVDTLINITVDIVNQNIKRQQDMGKANIGILLPISEIKARYTESVPDSNLKDEDIFFFINTLAEVVNMTFQEFIKKHNLGISENFLFTNVSFSYPAMILIKAFKNMDEVAKERNTPVQISPHSTKQLVDSILFLKDFDQDSDYNDIN